MEIDVDKVGERRGPEQLGGRQIHLRPRGVDPDRRRIDTTRERLERLFGPAAALELETTGGDLVTTRLSLPFQSAATVVETPGPSEGAR